MTLTRGLPADRRHRDQARRLCTGPGAAWSGHPDQLVWLPPWGPENITDEGRDQLRPRLQRLTPHRMASLPRPCCWTSALIVDDAYRPLASELAQTIHTLLGARRSPRLAQSIAADLPRWRLRAVCTDVPPVRADRGGLEQFAFIAPDCRRRPHVPPTRPPSAQRLARSRTLHVRPKACPSSAYAAGRQLLRCQQHALQQRCTRDFLERSAGDCSPQLYSTVGYEPNPELILRATRHCGRSEQGGSSDTRSRMSD